MRSAALALMLVLAPLAARAAEPDDSIRGVIRSQIDAFLQDDFTTAFTYASPAIKGMFRTPENFGAMVRNGYPMVWRPGSVEFAEREERGGRQFQRVILRDATGSYAAIYEMIETPEGWQINGVRIERLAEVGV